MTVQEMKLRKRELGYTNEMIAELSGVPLSTVQKVFGGSTVSPRKSTLDALGRVLGKVSRYAWPAWPDGMLVDGMKRPDVVREETAAYAVKDRVFTMDDVRALPDGVRAELLDGKLYFMATPTRLHQRVEAEMHLAVANYIRAHGGNCEVNIPPFSVYLYADESTYVEPDLVVVCDPSKLEDCGCVGAPDWVVEIISPSSVRLDMGKKLFKYREAGVREYWVIYPDKRMVTVYLFAREEERENVTIHTFEEEIPSLVVPGLKIRLADHL